MSTKHEREVRDAFYGGYACALTAALYGERGDHTGYREALGSVDINEFERWAKRNDDIILPRIREYKRFKQNRDRMLKRLAR